MDYWCRFGSLGNSCSASGRSDSGAALTKLRGREGGAG